MQLTNQPHDLRKNKSSITAYFYLFLIIHFCMWTIVPAIIRNNLSMDSIEGATWGHQLAWGYDKNPFVNAWLTRFAAWISGYQDWIIYFFCQLSVALCFWSVWKLGNRILTPTYALISVMILEGLQYYNFHALDFNDNTLELCFWGLASYFFYCALRDDRRNRFNTYKNWIAVGIFAGLGMMTKYYTAALLASMAILLLLNKDSRKQLTTLPPYIGLLFFVAIITPHVIWLFSHEFITVTYVFQRTSAIPSWTNHIIYPLDFTAEQFIVFAPAFVLLLPLLLWNRHRKRPEKLALSRFDKQFLFCVGLGPFLLTLLLAFFLGIRLRAGWGMPLQSLWGLIVIALLQPVVSSKRLNVFMGVVYTFLIIIIIGYIFSLVRSPDQSSANFPGRVIARTMTQMWHDKYQTPLAYVAGPRWINGNIAFYSADHPAVFMEWNPHKAFWINISDLNKKGGLFVWNLSNNERLPDEVKQAFPRLQQPAIYEFSWQRNVYHLKPIRLAVAILPPEGKKNKQP